METVQKLTPTRKSVQIFGPFSGGLLKRPSLLHTNSDWSDSRVYGFVSSRGTTFSRSLRENSNLQGWLLQVSWFTKTSESFAYELRLERFSRLRVRIVEGNNLQSKFVQKLESTGVVVASPSKAPRRKLGSKQK